MILDNTLVLSDSQVITATAASTNVIDLGATGTTYGASSALSADIGKSANVEVICNISQAFNNLTSLTVAIQVSVDAVFTSPVTVATGPAVPLASLTLGAQLSFPATLPEGVNLRYLRFYYTVAGTAPSTGKIIASVVAARQTNP